MMTAGCGVAVVDVDANVVGAVDDDGVVNESVGAVVGGNGRMGMSDKTNAVEPPVGGGAVAVGGGEPVSVPETESADGHHPSVRTI